MRNVLVVFEHQKHIDSNLRKFMDTLENVVSVDMYTRTVITSDVQYKLIGAGFPYVNSLGDRLNGMRFDEVMLHGDVVLTKQVEWYVESRMIEVKEFIEI